MRIALCATSGNAINRSVESVGAIARGIDSSGVEALSLWLPSGLLDLEQEISVRWNGKDVFRAVPARSFEVTMQAVLQRCDWRMLPETRIELR